MEGQNARIKFDKALALLSSNIKSEINRYLIDNSIGIRQRGTILYLLELFGIRPGGEKQETFGCCTLQVQHITFLSGNCIRLNFIGKKNIPYDKSKPVDQIVYNNLKEFTNGKNPKDNIFDNISPTEINEHLTAKYDITMKTFRIQKACITFMKYIEDNESNGDMVAVIKSALNSVKHELNHKSSPSVAKNYYVDPRLVFALIDKYKLQASDIYTDGELKQCQWASDTKDFDHHKAIYNTYYEKLNYI